VPGGTCPTGTVTFSNGKASKGGCHYEITQMQAQAAVGDVNGDGIQDILQGIKVDKGSSWDMWMYVYTVKNNKPVLVGFVTAGNLTGSAATGSVMAINVPRLANGKVSIEQDYSKLAQSQKRTFSWNGSRFVPSKAPLEARADARP
jgi:hypothetical protein